MREIIAGAIATAESALIDPDGAGSTLLGLASRLGEIDSSDTADLAYLAILLDSVGLHDESLLVLHEACIRFSSAHDSQPEAELRNIEGMILARRGEYQNALAALSNASSLAEDDSQLKAKIVANRAFAALRAGNLADAWNAIASIRVEETAPAPATAFAISIAGADAARLAGDADGLRKAVGDLREAAKRRIAELGSAHPQAVVVTADLAAVELDLARAECSRDRLEQVIEVLDAVSCRLAAEQGAGHPYALAAQANLASARVDLAILDGAFQRMVQAAESLNTVALATAAALGADHPQSLAVAACLAAAQVKIAHAERSITKADGAMSLYSAVVERMSSILGSNHPMAVHAAADAVTAAGDIPRLQAQTTDPHMLAQQGPARPSNLGHIRFRILGPLEVWVDQEWREISAPKWRSVLCALLINSGQVVSADALIDEVWGNAVPSKAANLVSIYVLRLRRLLGPDGGDLLVTRAPGYQIYVGPMSTDAQQFEAMVRDGRNALAAGDPERAAGHLAGALALWRGSPLADVPRSPLVAAEAERLTELRLDAAELRIAAELACGNHSQVVPELRGLLTDNPLREGLWALLLKALAGSGRRAEALDAYVQARNIFADELGVEPSAELREQYAELLAEGSADDTADTISAAQAQVNAPDAWNRAAAAQPEEPAARAAVQCPAQLPADIADFTGREDQVKHVCDLLAATEHDGGEGQVRIALVTGYGGLGKTSLAVHAAHQIRHAFPDGQLYVDLRGATAHPLKPADVLARLLRDLGIDGRDIPHEEAERADRYRTRLVGRRILVVLDNAKDSAQVRPLLPGSASCAVLITTRNRMLDLPSSELVDLNVLDDDEALTLFTRVVGDERAAAEPEATAELLLACAGLPLAIRVCAAMLATRSGWSIQTMTDQLHDEHRRLDEVNAGDLAVRSSFEISFASLPTLRHGMDPALAFRLLGLWRGPSISGAAAAALFGCAEDRAVDALEVLVDAHLLESRSPERYKFHDLLRVYAAERAEADLAAEDRNAAVSRLLGWYMRAADIAATACSPHRYTMPIETGPADPPATQFTRIDDALAWYDSERVNIISAIRQAAGSGLHDIAWRLAPPLYILCNRRGNWADCVAMHRIALESVRAVGNRQGEAWVLNNLGDALGVTRDSEAISCLEQSLAIRRETGDRGGEAQAVNNLADAYEELGRREEAVALLQRAVDLNREAHHPYGEAVALSNLGAALLHVNRAREAAGVLEKACAVFARLNSANGIGYALHNLGECYLSLGRTDEAIDCLQRAVATHQATGNKLQQAVSLRTLGTAQQRGALAIRARASRTQAADILDELGDHERAAELRAEHRNLTSTMQWPTNLTVQTLVRI